VADITNRSRYRVSVKNRDDLTALFPFNKLAGVETYMAGLRAQQLKPRVEQLEDSWLVRIREKGHKPLSITFNNRKEAESYVLRTTEERSRGLFTDYTISRKVSLAQLMVRYLLEEAPRHKSHRVLAYSIEGWLADSGPAGAALVEEYHTELRRRDQPVRERKFQMRRSSDELTWIHKPLADITTVDIEGYITDRLDVVEPSTVDREIDRFKSIFKVALSVWDYPLAKNPMDAVRRPKYFNERDRRISEDEETRLLKALAQLDFERAVETRLKELAEAELASQPFTSLSARKKVLAKTRARLKPVAEETAEVIPYLQVFYLFQVMTAARRGETLGLPWKHIDFTAQTAFLPETKNGRARKLSLRADLIAHLREFPQDTDHVFNVGLDYLVGAWNKACSVAGIVDLHIHDARHEGLSRLAESGQFTLPELQAFSGHRDLRMLMRYAHLSSSRLARKLDECFSNTAKVRVHRGRKYLNKSADIPLSDVVGDVDEEQKGQESDATTMAALSATMHAPSVAPSTTENDHRVKAAPSHRREDAPAGNIIAFPTSRIVRAATADPMTTSVPAPRDSAA